MTASNFVIPLVIAALTIILLTSKKKSTDILLTKEPHLENLIAKISSESLYVYKPGCTSVTKFVDMWGTDISDSNSFTRLGVPSSVMNELIEEATKVKQILIVKQWLKNMGLSEVETVFRNLGANDLNDIHRIKDADLEIHLSPKYYIIGKNSIRKLQYSDESYEDWKIRLWSQIDEEDNLTSWATYGRQFFTILVAAFILVIIVAFWGSGVNYVSSVKSQVSFDWNEPHTVGKTVSFTIKLYQFARMYRLSNPDDVEVIIEHNHEKIVHTIEFGGSEVSDSNKAIVKFTVRRAGDYLIYVNIKKQAVKGSPFYKAFLPDRPDPAKSSLNHYCSSAIGFTNNMFQLDIDSRDKYDNSSVDCSGYHVNVAQVIYAEGLAEAPFKFSFRPCDKSTSVVLGLRFPESGIFRVNVTQDGHLIKNGNFYLLIVDELDMVTNFRRTLSGELVTLNGEVLPSPKMVYFYITPMQLIVTEYVFKIFPKRIETFRLSSALQFQFIPKKNSAEPPLFKIKDGFQEIGFTSTDVKNIAAYVYIAVRSKCGGVKSFKAKQEFFYKNLVSRHGKEILRSTVKLDIDRCNVLASSMLATRNFGIKDWCKKFLINFVEEQGIDYGGLRREWFEILTSDLFNPENMLFVGFTSNKQDRVHPCPARKRPPHLNLEWYEFAGKVVGKCLYESSLGTDSRQHVIAKFSRSFLAQLLGLRVDYLHFEQDDPDLFIKKIQYILENDIEDMDMYFVEEEYDSRGQLEKVAELIPKGSSTRVTNENKEKYLSALAQYRLRDSVIKEILAFLKGLNLLIPDSELMLFDENELELLMCGSQKYKVHDLKENCSTTGFQGEFEKIQDWFWAAVSSYTEEEWANLLQFTTGCSHLPSGGFAELNPKFSIIRYRGDSRLPTAHTCFNMLCLPNYDSYEEFERALSIAITEGNKGFGLA